MALVCSTSEQSIARLRTLVGEHHGLAITLTHGGLQLGSVRASLIMHPDRRARAVLLRARGQRSSSPWVVGGRARQAKAGFRGDTSSLSFSTPQMSPGHARYCTACRAEATGRSCVERLERRHAVLKQHSACPRPG